MSDIPTAQTVETIFPITFGFDIQTGPDGNHWPVMIIGANFAQTTVMFPVEMGEQLVSALPQALTEIISKCKLADGNQIVVAGADALHTLKGTRHGQ